MIHADSPRAVFGSRFTIWVFHFLPAVPDPPLIDLSNSRVYNEASIFWRLSDDHLPTDHHMLEYRRFVLAHKLQ